MGTLELVTEYVANFLSCKLGLFGSLKCSRSIYLDIGLQFRLILALVILISVSKHPVMIQQLIFPCCGLDVQLCLLIILHVNLYFVEFLET